MRDRVAVGFRVLSWVPRIGVGLAGDRCPVRNVLCRFSASRTHFRGALWSWGAYAPCCVRGPSLPYRKPSPAGHFRWPNGSLKPSHGWAEKLDSARHGVILKRLVPLLILLSLLAVACGSTDVVTEELGPRSDEQAVPADTTTTTTTEAKDLIEIAINQFFDALNDGDIAGAYQVMAPQHRDQCTLEQAEAIGAEPSDENTLFEVVEVFELSGGAMVTVLDHVAHSEMPGVAMVLDEGDWYVDVPLCMVLENYQLAASDTETMRNLRNALATEKAYFSVNQAFTDDAVVLATIEPNLFNTGDDPVTPFLSANGSVCLESVSDSGTHFGIWDSPVAGTQYGLGFEPLFANGCPDQIDGHDSGLWSTAGW